MLRKVTDASQLELLIWWFIRNSYEKNQKQNVPVTLKYVISKFSARIFQSKILSFKQDLTLSNLLQKNSTHSYIRKTKLLYRGTEHNFSTNKFHELSDGHGNTITIIEYKTKYSRNVFGGYTNIPWTSATDQEYYAKWLKDKGYSFLFKLYEPEGRAKIWRYKDGEEVAHRKTNGPMFGSGCEIEIKTNGKMYSSITYAGNGYELESVGNLIGNGSVRYGEIFMDDYEVLEIL